MLNTMFAIVMRSLLILQFNFVVALKKETDALDDKNTTEEIEDIQQQNQELDKIRSYVDGKENCSCF